VIFHDAKPEHATHAPPSAERPNSSGLDLDRDDHRAAQEVAVTRAQPENRTRARDDAPGASINRTAALSDGVFAIAMTLLVLDLRTPPHSDGRLLRALVEQWPAYVSFLASFLYIGVIWINHHATFRQIRSTDRSVMWANLGILCGTVLLPFPTAVITDAFRQGSHVDEQTAAILTPRSPSSCRRRGSHCSCFSTGGPTQSPATGASHRGVRKCADRWSAH
jgi:hypothetical protein